MARERRGARRRPVVRGGNVGGERRAQRASIGGGRRVLRYAAIRGGGARRTTGPGTARSAVLAATCSRPETATGGVPPPERGPAATSTPSREMRRRPRDALDGDDGVEAVGRGRGGRGDGDRPGSTLGDAVGSAAIGRRGEGDSGEANRCMPSASAEPGRRTAGARGQCDGGGTPRQRRSGRGNRAVRRAARKGALMYGGRRSKLGLPQRMRPVHLKTGGERSRGAPPSG